MSLPRSAPLLPLPSPYSTRVFRAFTSYLLKNKVPLRARRCFRSSSSCSQCSLCAPSSSSATHCCRTARLECYNACGASICCNVFLPNETLAGYARLRRDELLSRKYIRLFSHHVSFLQPHPAGLQHHGGVESSEQGHHGQLGRSLGAESLSLQRPGTQHPTDSCLKTPQVAVSHMMWSKGDGTVFALFLSYPVWFSKFALFFLSVRDKNLCHTFEVSLVHFTG